MATRVLAIVAAVMVTGCGQRLDSFSCTDDASCGAGGKCEPGFNLCSFADPDCGPDGRSFGTLAGAQHGQCVGNQPRPDAGAPPDGRLPDGTPPDAAPVCYGAAPFSVCFLTAPTGTINVNTATTFDTGTGTGTGTQLTCVTPLSGGTGYCVLAADTITISSPLRAIGGKPLVLVAASAISVPSSIDVGSRRLPTESIGAGADPGGTSCNAGIPPTTAGGTSGGGAGGSFTGNGGNGGLGGGAAGGAPGAHGLAPGLGIVIRGGCPGQDGAGPKQGARGHGGGAVFLFAGNSITVGGTINAGGEGGAPGTDNDSGGGGGGAGGMIGLSATTFNVTGFLSANGGGGAEGSGSNTAGNPGGDATSTSTAPGGSNNSTNGGDGGPGGGTAAATGGTGTTGQDGGAANGGGGGGGGGAGIIKGPPASLGTNVSPAATP